jgi:hypothetical protein
MDGTPAQPRKVSALALLVFRAQLITSHQPTASTMHVIILIQISFKTFIEQRERQKVAAGSTPASPTAASAAAAAREQPRRRLPALPHNGMRAASCF